MKNINNKVFWILFVLSNLIWLPLLVYRSMLFMDKHPLIHGGLALEPNMPAAFLITLIHAIILIFDRKKKKTKQDLIMISIIFIPAIILLVYTIYN
jgi:hypothetical protein